MSEQTSNPADPDVSSVVNIAAYRFVTLNELPRRRDELKDLCNQLELKGSILLSEEGINLFVAGTRAAIDGLLKHLRSDPLLAEIETKESLSGRQPFNRMLVKIKDEIISFGVDGVDPRVRATSKLSAGTLKQWLDEGRRVHLLDTRNDYEVELGTFRNAHAVGVDHFRDFPEAVRSLPQEMHDEPVVMFCTGGIRCEKAGPFMEREGFSQVFQLDGGILKYFEECGGEHYDGDCFVFDQRVALNSKLEETSAQLCFSCYQALSDEDQSSPQYVPGQSCPHCFESSERKLTDLLASRNAAIRAAVNPLPGSVSYENRLPLNVPQKYAGHSLIDFLTERFPRVSRDEWLELIVAGRIVGRRLKQRNRAARRAERNRPIKELEVQPAPEQIVKEGERFDRLIPATIEPDVATNIEVVYEDDAIVVVNKPAPLPIHASGRFNRNTLESILNGIYRPQKLRIAHRLDADTSGIVVFSRTQAVARVVQPQFKERTVEKAYVVRVHGIPDVEKFSCCDSIQAEPSDNGLRIICSDGLPAETHFVVSQRFDDGTALIEASPVTGRTNQIRIHLWHCGFPVCGDPSYLRGGELGTNECLKVGDPPLCLHARSLTLTHPTTSARVSFSGNMPEWARGEFHQAT